jgi:hypothetical protein
VIAGGAAPQPQAVEGEAQVGGGVGAEGQQFAHQGESGCPIKKLGAAARRALAKNV